MSRRLPPVQPLGLPVHLAGASAFLLICFCRVPRFLCLCSFQTSASADYRLEAECLVLVCKRFSAGRDVHWSLFCVTGKKATHRAVRSSGFGLGPGPTTCGFGKCPEVFSVCFLTGKNRDHISINLLGLA